MKFKSKPKIIEAVQFNSEVGGVAKIIAWAHSYGGFIRLTDKGLIVKTPEGDHLATRGDWIIKGLHNEFYPCKPDIFEKSYEAVE